MKFVIASLCLAAVSFQATASTNHFSSVGEGALTFASASTSMATPEAKARSGSKRVGGHNHHGKGSHYRGGHK